MKFYYFPMNGLIYQRAQCLSFNVDLRSSEQLVHEDAEGPEVHRSVVTLVQDDLRSNILRSAAECPCLPPGINVFGEAKVDHLYVAFLI